MSLGVAGIMILISPIIGSFIGLLVVRLPLGEPIALDRSRCRTCATTLTAGDLVPILSWLWHRGACRYCRQPVSVLYPGVELAAIAVACWMPIVPGEPPVIASCVLGWFLLALSVIDARHFILPNMLTIPLLLCGLAESYALLPDILTAHLAGAAIGYIALQGIRWLYGVWRGEPGLGQGDAKLLAALGAWVGWHGLPSIILIGSIAALSWVALASLLGRRYTAKTRIPFGPFLSIGGWIVWIYGPVTAG